ncbi:hypothetical protein ACFCT7_08925 [Fulvivirgaceae bacterium LMO-SS25]
MINSFKTKNHFIDDLKNPVIIGIAILLLFINIYLSIIFLSMFLLYVSWRSNVLEITENELIITYPNWIFWKKNDCIKLNRIQRVSFEHSVQGAYATISYFDLFLNENKRMRILYTPSISKSEYEKFVFIIKDRIGY